MLSNLEKSSSESFEYRGIGQTRLPVWLDRKGIRARKVIRRSHTWLERGNDLRIMDPEEDVRICSKNLAVFTVVDGIAVLEISSRGVSLWQVSTRSMRFRIHDICSSGLVLDKSSRAA